QGGRKKARTWLTLVCSRRISRTPAPPHNKNGQHAAANRRAYNVWNGRSSRMRGVIYLLLILAAVIVVGVIWLGIHPQSWLPQVSSALSAIGPSPKSAPANPSGKPKPFDEKSRAHSRDGRPIPEGPRS